MACPSDFEVGLNNTCRIKCPRGFKYLQGSGGDSDKCVYESNNEHAVTIQAVPIAASTTAFADERTRFNGDLAKVYTDMDARRALDDENKLSGYETKYSSFQTKYAGFKSMQQNADLLAQTMQELKPLRPATAPGSAELERKRILSITSEQVRVAQTGLVTALLCLLIYVLVPVPLAHGIAFLIACIGIAIGIFLMSNK